MSAELGTNLPGTSAGVANTPAPVNQPSAPAVAPQAEVNAPSELELAMRTEMKARFQPESLGAMENNSLPAGLLDGTQKTPPDAEVQARIAGETGQPQPGQTQEQLDAEAAAAETAAAPGREDGREEITAIHLPNFGRDFSLSEVEAAIEGYNYYHPRAMRLQEDVQRLQTERQEFESLKSSPDMQLVAMLRSDPALKEKFRELARNHNPQSVARQGDNQEMAALKAELAEMKANMEQGKKVSAEKEQGEKQAAWQRHILNVTKEVDQTVNQKIESVKASGVEISEEEIDYITQNAVASVKTGQLKYEPAALAAYYSRAIDIITQKAIAARNQSVAGYQQVKKNLPPPPPTGGAAPVIQADSPRSFGDFQGVLANRLESALNQL